MQELKPLCCPAIVLLIAAVLILCAVVMAGRAADNASETWQNIHKEKIQ